MQTARTILSCSWLLQLLLTSAWAFPQEPEYNRDILPILAENCFACHGPDKATRQAKLRLDNFEEATSSLEHAAAIVPFQPSMSEMILRLANSDADLRMPPTDSGKQLTARQIELLGKWVAAGAVYQPHWSLVDPKPTWAYFSEVGRTTIDRFVLTAMPKDLGGFNPPAEPSVLARRLYLDLTGIPPPADEVLEFINDRRGDAFERLVDRLLASPRFGERWSRWWLDLAHYADSDGYLQDFLRPHAWRYRDWVVDAFNSDMPFDRFTVAQLAGDILASDLQRAGGDPAEIQQLRIATGFLRNTLSNREGGADLEEYRVRQTVDRTVTVATTWLGLTVGCAECHDHKYDPITQTDFYRLFAYFNNCDEVNFDAPLPDELSSYSGAHERYLESRQALIGDKANDIERLQTTWEDKLLWTEQHPGADHRWDRLLEILGLIWGQGDGEGQLEGLNIIKTPRAERLPMQQARLQDYFLQHGSQIDPKAFTQLELEALSAKLTALAAQLPKVSRPQGITVSTRLRQTHVHTRGDFRRPAQAVEPGIPQVLLRQASDQPADRAELALWLVSRENPLSARVLVNRLWQELFGRGIVSTSENLGVRGAVPSHPELLDWLASEMLRRQWSLKELIRQMVTTEVYQQSSQVEPQKKEVDPQNAWLARGPRLRLTAEGVRDTLLFTSGLLDGRIGGASVRPPQPASVTSEGFDNKWEVSLGGDRYRRGVYTFWQRTSPFAQSINFDMPDSSRSCTRRERSNTPLQALALMNDPVLLEGAVMAARNIVRLTDHDDRAKLEDLHLQLLSRYPNETSRKRLLQYLQAEWDHFRAQPKLAVELVSHRPEVVAVEGDVVSWAAWSMVASVLLNLDEAINRP